MGCNIKFVPLGDKRFGLFDLNLDKGYRVWRTVHDVMPDTRRALIGLAGNKRNIGYIGSIVNPQGSIHEHDNKVGPSMLVPARDRTRLKIPAGYTDGVVILLNGRYCGEIALECHLSSS